MSRAGWALRIARVMPYDRMMMDIAQRITTPLAARDHARAELDQKLTQQCRAPEAGTSPGVNIAPGSNDDGWTVPEPVTLADGTRVQLYKDGEALKAGYRAIERRSEEHTSELQSPCNIVCRLLLEKKK